MNSVTKTPLTQDAARALTDRIRGAADQLWSLLLEAHESKAWKALGYTSWESYIGAEFDMSRRRSYQIIDQAKVIGALREAAGGLCTKVHISEREARDIKPHLSEVTEEIRERVEQGEDPAQATYEVIEAKRVGRCDAEPEEVESELEELPEASGQPDPVQTKPQSRGVGLRYAHEAIAVLKRIPIGDGLRQDAFSTVADWIETNRGDTQ